jgi:hypothetical protein
LIRVNTPSDSRGRMGSADLPLAVFQPSNLRKLNFRNFENLKKFEKNGILMFI